MTSKSSSLIDQALKKVENDHSHSKKSPFIDGLAKAQATCNSLNKELNMLAYAISHDLEQPLRHIMAYSKLLARKVDGQEDPEMQKFADFIQSAGLTLDLRINGILTYSRLSQRSVHTETIHTETTIREIFSSYEKEAEIRNLDFQTQNLPIIQTDAHLFTLIFKELIENAFYFTTKEENPRILISASQKNGLSTFSIQDNGVGLEGNKFERMTKLFQQGDHSIPKSSGSLGLGLSMVKRAINMLAGSFGYRETPEGHTCFQIML